MHKTGSTSIQLSLKDFCDNNFVYARFEDDPYHTVPITALFSRNARDVFARRERLGKGTIKGSAASFKADLERMVALADGKTLILSSEGIYSMFGTDDLAAMKSYLDDHFDDYRFVAYVRSPGSFLSSVFQQVVKSAGCDQLDVSSLYKSYRKAFEKFDKVFGRERVSLWKFDPSRFPSGDVVRDFCARLNIDLPTDRIVRSNESLSRDRVALLFAYNRFCKSRNLKPIPRNMLGSLIRALDEFGGGRFRLSPDAIRPVLEANKADVIWIEKRLGVSMSDDLGDHQNGDIRDEADLLQPNPEMATKLRELLGRPTRKQTQGNPPELARLVHAWADGATPSSRQLSRLSAELPARPRSRNQRLSAAARTRQSADKTVNLRPKSANHQLGGLE